MSNNLGLALVRKLHARLVHERRIAVLAHQLSAFLRPGWQVLDVGCGDGKLAGILCDLIPNLQIRGVEVLIRPDCRIQCESYDGMHLPFADDSFDACLIVDVLHHATDPLAVLTDAGRISRECVLIKDHIAENAVDRWTLRFMDVVGNRPHGVSIPARYLSSSAWREMCIRSDLVPGTMSTDIALYPFPFSMLFGRQLHLIVQLKTTKKMC